MWLPLNDIHTHIPCLPQESGLCVALGLMLSRAADLQSKAGSSGSTPKSKKKTGGEKQAAAEPPSAPAAEEQEWLPEVAAALAEQVSLGTNCPEGQQQQSQHHPRMQGVGL